MKIQRYDAYEIHEYGTDYLPAEDGDVCKSEDVADLEAKCAELEAKCAQLEALNAEMLEALHTLMAVIGLTPIIGNKAVLQEAFDNAQAAVAKAECEVMP